MIQNIARVASTIVSLYMMVIFIRIILTWFRGVSYGRAYELLASITDPYLNWFRRNVPVRFGALDFSAVAGILVLGLVNNILTQIAFTGTVSVGHVLMIIIAMLWSLIRFFLVIFLVIGVVRLVGMVTSMDNSGRFWATLEQITNPLLAVVVRPFLRGRFTGYQQSLLIYCGVLAGAILVGQLASGLLMQMARAIPF